MSTAAPDSRAGKPRRRNSDEPGHRQTTWPELLNDLVFTVIIAQLAHRLLADDSDQSFAEFVLLYIPVWWLWNGETHYSTRFDNEQDVVHRALTSLQLIGLIILAATIPQAVESDRLATIYALTYAGVRLILLIEYGRAAYYMPESRPYIRHISRGFGASVVLWALSVFVPLPYRYGIWGLALLIELSTPLTASGGNLHRDFPPDVRHLPERYGLFTLLVLGQSVTSAVGGLTQRGLALTPMLATALSGFIVIGIWWAYFDRVDSEAVESVGSEKSVAPYAFWLYLHLPLTLALTMVGVGVMQTIRYADADVLPHTVQLLMSGSVGAYFLVQAGISLTTLVAGGPHPSIVRGVLARAGLGIGAGILAFTPHLSALWLLGLLSLGVLTLIVSDTVGTQAPSTFDRKQEPAN